MSNVFKILTKSFLYKEYIINKKPSTQIAEEIGCQHTTILRSLKRNNIKPRTISEAREGKYKGKNNPNYTDGRSSRQYYCKDCLKKGIKTKISIDSGLYGGGRCSSCAGKKLFKNPKNNPMYGKIATHGRGTHYKQSYMRSTWEIKYARYCIINHIKYRYEPKAFEIAYKYKGKKKEGTYRPDFYLPKQDLYIEIKGWWRDKAKVKFTAFKRQYKNIKIRVLKKINLITLGIL